MAARYLQRLAERLITAALAQHRQHEMVHDPIIEPVARYADARRPQRHAASRGTGGFDPHDRKIAGAAAEIRDQNRRGFGQAAGIAERRAQWFIDIMDVGAEPSEHRVIAFARQRFVGPRSGIFHRSPHHDPLRPRRQRAARMADHPVQKHRAKLLEPESLFEHIGGFEDRAGGHRLERLEKTAVFGIFHIFGDRPRPRLMRQSAFGPFLMPEAQGRSKHRAGRLIADKVHKIRLLAGRDGDDAVGRAEI